MKVPESHVMFHPQVAERPIWREGDGGGKKRGKGVTVLVVD